MTDYWKSQPKKFCQYCKCWIADNKPSIEFHEKGKNHKQNVSAKIEEIKKTSISKAKKEEKMSKEFAKMEEAALKAFEEDMKRLQGESGSSVASVVPRSYTLVPAPKQPEKRQIKSKGTKKPNRKPPTDVWIMGVTDEGQKYYYNTVTGESQWEKPDGFKDVSSAEQTETTSGSVWVEAVTPEGYTYYYNKESGESRWDKPPELTVQEENSEGAEVPSTEAPLKSDETNQDLNETLDPAESTQSQTPKISFRKRKEEMAPPCDTLEKKEKSEELEEPKQGENQEDTEVEQKKEEDTEEKIKKDEDTGEEENKKEEVPVEEPEGNSGAVRRKECSVRSRKVNPYGEWEKIKEEVDPYANVDLQLPQTDGGDRTTNEPPPEPKPKFKERIITSLGDGSSVGATFKKRNPENVRSRRLRQRETDE